jgi:putative ABC transport system permease protein
MNGRLRELWSRFLSLFHRRTLEDEFDEELACHIEMAIEDNIRAGMNEEEARRKALLRLGGKTQVCEVHREAWGYAWLDSLREDTRYVLRSCRRSPGFALAVIAILALGIGSVTAIFSAVDQVIFQKPFPHFERLAFFGSYNASYNSFVVNSYPVQILPCIEKGRSFEAFAIKNWKRGGMNAGDDTFGVNSGRISRDYFSVLNGKAELGRLFRPSEFTVASSNVMVLRHQFWKDYFGGDPGVIGRSVVLENRSYQIVGVLSKRFPYSGLYPSDVFTPLVLAHDPAESETLRVLEAITRLRPGITLAQANAEASVLCAAPNASTQFREQYRQHPMRLRSLAESGHFPHFSIIHGALLGAVAFLLAIACINAINLILVRLSERRRELSIRSALGGTRSRIIRLIIIESLILNTVAGLTGLCLALGMKPIVLAILTQSDEILENGINLDGRALLVALIVTVFSTLIISLVPAWKLPIRDPQSILRESGNAFSEGRCLQQTRASLVVLCAAMAMVLLTGTGLMTSSVRKLLSVDRGFDANGKIGIWIDLPKHLQEKGPRQAFADRIEERLRRLPGVRNIGETGVLPLMGTSGRLIPGPDGNPIDVEANHVSPGFFRGMGLRLLKGRWLPSRPEGTIGVMVINASMARKWFGKEDPVGRRIKITQKTSWIVLGVVSDIRIDIRSKNIRPQYYFPTWQIVYPRDVFSLLLDLSVQPSSGLIQSVRKAIHEVDPQAGVRMPMELEKEARKEINTERFMLFILSLLSVISTLLAVFGLFSVMSYSVNLRMKDIGIRLALGAPARHVFRSVMGRGLTLGVMGITIGLFGSWMLTRFIGSLLYETNPIDPAIYSITALLMFLAVCLACWLPAKRAARVDPICLLRME